jgi:hypothetical protein
MSKTPSIKNSEIVKEILQKLYDISSRKTTEIHAISTMDKSLDELEKKYNFLRSIEIKDTRFSEMEEPITVMTDIDNVKSNELGRAIYDIIKTMNNSLGEGAGHFFIKEFRNSLGEETNSLIEEMGIDLGLLQLEFEVEEMSRKL